MKKILFCLAMLTWLDVSQANTSEIKFECTYDKYSDILGTRAYSKPIKLLISWDRNSNTGYLIRGKKLSKVKVSEGVDLMSFVDFAGDGTVQTASITKLNGDSVFSINRFGLSQQAYGLCRN